MDRDIYRKADEAVVSGAQTGAITDVSRTFMNRVYNWMASGLLITGITAWLVFQNEALRKAISTNQASSLVLAILTLAIVIVLSFALHKLNAATAAVLFVVYSALVGAMFSSLFIAYTASAIYMAFFTTAGTFAATSIYGYITKTDLSSIGGFAIMALIGLIIASVVNFFLRSEMFYWILTYATVIIFVALTAYDTQKLKRVADSMTEEDDVFSETGKKIAIIAALGLYLDFINLFLAFLRIFGGRNR